MKYTPLNIKAAAELIAVHPDTLRRYHKNGKLIPARILPGGHRQYTEEQLAQFTINQQKGK